MYVNVFTGFSVGMAIWVIAYLLNRAWLGFKSLIT